MKATTRPAVTDILRIRRRRARQQARHSGLPAGLSAILAISLLAVLAILATTITYVTFFADLPSLAMLPALLDYPGGQLLEPTRLFDRSGIHELAVLENPAASGHQYLFLQAGQTARFSEELIQATLAAEDPGFWEHNGSTLAGLDSEAHATLAQKLVFETLLSTEPPSLRRNLRERLLAAQATAYFGREQILEWYLNHAHYGDLIYGADAAARVYLGKPATNLSLAEAALLAAIGRQPEINPNQAPQLVFEEQKGVLQSMLEHGWIDAEDALQAAQAEIDLQPAQASENPAPAFIKLALAQLASQIPQERVERGGWRIITTLDYDLQIQAACATEMLTARFTTMPPDLSDTEINACQAARLLPTLPESAQKSLPDLDSEVIVLDPVTGQVLSLVSNILLPDPSHAPARPFGTLSMPFLYLTAFTRGYSPGSLAWDVPQQTGAATLPQENYHGPVRLRTALVNDYREPSRQLLAQFGLGSTLTMMRQLGALSGDEPGSGTPQTLPGTGSGALIQDEGDEMAALLSQPGSLLGAVQAYATISNQGASAGQEFSAMNRSPAKLLQPYTILQVEDRSGQVWLDWSTPQQRSVLSPQLAHLLNHVLSDEPARWPELGHPNPLEIGRPAGAKLGKTSLHQDAWVVGYTPQRLAGIWLGIPEGQQSAQLPELAAAALWHAVIQYALRDQPATGWAPPLGISEIQVCDPSGLLPTIYCPTVVNEVFLTGSEPTQLDNLYRISQINRETGRLATVFTPPELLEARVYLVVPQEARDWAEKAGLSTPPEDYDILYAPPTTSPDVQILTPVMFSHVHGKVTLIGTAAGGGFKSFRLNFGQGLNPQQWLQIGQESSKVVRNGTLGVWDTTDLSGLYALQLQVIRQDQRVETAIIQVTIDNLSPEISLLNPLPGDTFRMEEKPVIVLSVSARDNVELASVTFEIDDHTIATFAQPNPTQENFSLAWSTRLGEHTFKAISTDLAGNQSEQSLSFTVK